MKATLLLIALCAACSHGDGAVQRDEQASARHYRDAYETSAQEIARLKARIAELEQQNCR